MYYVDELMFCYEVGHVVLLGMVMVRQLYHHLSIDCWFGTQSEIRQMLAKK